MKLNTIFFVAGKTSDRICTKAYHHRALRDCNVFCILSCSIFDIGLT
ncbi:hypothetical protein V1478_001690 [Vespula squamosa]|uniref:Uncharacterized protein n=1 Tax=Vespula squamosa TaxID=30214 RepID=A0ABD2BXU0_VESSQ